MGEIGTDAGAVEAGEELDNASTDTDLESMIDAELAKPAEEVKADADKGGAVKGADGAAAADGTGKKPPEAQPSKTDTTEAEKAFLKDAGFTDEEIKDVSPKELERLKKAHGFYSGKIKTAEDRATFFGKSNKELSERYQAQQKTLKEVMAQQTPADRAKGIIKTIDRSKLSPGVQKLLDDPEMLEFMGLFIPGAKEEPEADPAPAAGKDGAGAGDPAVSRQQAEESILQVISSVKQSPIIMKSHPDIAEVYGSKEFQDWTETLSNIEVMKVFSPDPLAHKELLDRYDAHKAAEEVRQRKQQEHKEQNDALRAHGSPAGGLGEAEDYTPTQILNDDKAFQAMKARMRKNRVRGG